MKIIDGLLTAFALAPVLLPLNSCDDQGMPASPDNQPQPRYRHEQAPRPTDNDFDQKAALDALEQEVRKQLPPKNEKVFDEIKKKTVEALQPE